MARPPPKITPAQLRHLAKVSRVQSDNETAQRKAAEQLPELVEMTKRLTQLNDSLAANLRWWNRYGHWIARATLLPLSVLSLGLVTLVLLGLWNGEIRQASRYSRTTVTLEHSPVMYWFAISYHATMAAFFVWLTRKCIRAAKLIRSSAT
jgi:hypothetical protein